MKFTHIYFEPDVLNYTLGKELHNKFKDLPWTEIKSHNNIEEMQKKPNSEFAKMKQNLIIGTRKTHKYTPNFKVSDYLVPYTSSGCTAMCMYCYLVCNYNKCSYLRLFVNREQMLEKINKFSNKFEDAKTYEIGSNSDLVLENTITGNLEWTIKNFKDIKKGRLTFPTKFDMVDPLLDLPHNGNVIFRMSVNPQSIIQKIEIGTSSLQQRINAVNKMCDAGYSTGILIAPIIHIDNWKDEYSNLISFLASELTQRVKNQLVLELIFMTYSYVHRAINSEVFPNAMEIYNKEHMTGKGRGKYAYKTEIREEMEPYILDEIKSKLPEAKILYVC